MSEKYEFDTLVDRSGTGNEKYSGLSQAYHNAGAISYSGAELDVKTAPCIRQALSKRALEGIYGYTKADDKYLDAVVNWMRMCRNWEIQKDWIVPSYGTLQTICAAIRAFTKKDEGIIVQPPVYVLYAREILRTGRKVVNNPLIYDSGVYHIDFNQLEEVMSDPKNKLMVLCNPHNPIMDIWEKEDLEKIASLARKYDVIVVSDEIFAEHSYIGPMISYADVGADHCIVTTSLGKAFNFTGSSHANAIIPDEKIRNIYTEQRNSDHFGSIDPFIYTALTAAYTKEGKEWIDALLEYSAENERIVREFFAEHFPKVTVCRHRAGTLLWIDLHSFGLNEEALHKFLKEDALFIGDTGSIYGEGGECFTRIEIGTPRAILVKALNRIKDAAQRKNISAK